MELRRERVEKVAATRLKEIQLGDDVCIEVGGPANQLTQTPQGPQVFEAAYCFVLTLGHNLLGTPPIIMHGVVPGPDLPDANIRAVVDGLIEAARQRRAELQHVPSQGDIGADLRKNPRKRG